MSDNATPPPPPPPGSGQGGGYGAPPPPGQGGGYGAPPPAPSYEAGGVQGTPPPNYLVWAILSTIFCCLPFGIASIVFAAQVNGKWNSGDHAGAQDSSAKAKRFAIIAAVVGVVVNGAYAAFVLPNLGNS
ncbi:CD225/dispanin family protein [Phycicoccus sp. M110.8]|uniref:CD225/dispanin family protein n=1 Tax=Phycicoccus sp. M110.8 TaxID=3075433 RepID=UPI0028FD77C1|nr:CD225/dispanin family protein [Phycicoccus sp. M110.8]MDU0313309.1 CD225/dispanin family protein [Phycicoccus sp. M110.8]HET8766244.1 CD225/dispanin family protein [Pedococcus sp.]